jgi:hypothetical protein
LVLGTLAYQHFSVLEDQRCHHLFHEHDHSRTGKRPRQRNTVCVIEI